MVMTIARKLAESKRLNRMLRKNIYIHGVQCACESYETASKTFIDGRNCFCEVDVDLLGSNKKIRTNKDQSTNKVSIEINAKNFMKYADMETF